MLYWIFTSISALFSLYYALENGIGGTGSCLMFLIAFIPLMLVSTFIFIVLSLIVPDGPPIVKIKYYYPIVSVKDGIITFTDEMLQTRLIREADIDLHINDTTQSLYLEKVEYTEGGFKGYWLIKTANYAPTWIVHAIGQNSSNTTE